MKCKVCSNEVQTQPQSEYCGQHQKAYENVQRKPEAWKKALDTEWKDYLSKIAKNPLTGIWAKEVAENSLQEEEICLNEKECLNHNKKKSIWLQH